MEVTRQPFRLLRPLPLTYFLFRMVQNELILVAVLDAIFDTVHSLLRGQADKRTMLENLELVLLTIDEVVRYVASSAAVVQLTYSLKID